jgi:hypothetical protein
MHLLSLFAFTAAAGIMATLSYAQDNACFRTPPRDGGEKSFLEEEFGTTFFQINPLGNGKDKTTPIGTATLIDSRGLFISAAHILERQLVWGDKGTEDWSDESKSKGNYPHKLRLLNLKTGVEVIVKEAGRHRLREDDPDISFLVKESGELNVLSPQNVVNLFLGDAGNIDPTRTKVGVFGFPVEKKESGLQELQYKEASELNAVNKREDIVYADYDVPNGLSGALAINPHGLGIGILSGNNPGKGMATHPNRTFFTLTNGTQARKLIADTVSQALGLSDFSRKIMTELGGTGLTKESAYYLFENKKLVKQVDLVLLLLQVSSDIQKYMPKTSEEKRGFKKLITCNNVMGFDPLINRFFLALSTE